MTSHTPAPWHADLAETFRVRAKSGTVAMLTFLGRGKHREKDEVIANAHLVAAAPDMLSALKFARPLVEKWCHYQGETEELFDEYLGPVDDAIAKAEGRK